MNDKDNTNGLQPKGTGTLTLQSIAKNERALSFKVKESKTQVWMSGLGFTLCLNNLASNLGPVTGAHLTAAIHKYIEEENDGQVSIVTNPDYTRGYQAALEWCDENWDKSATPSADSSTQHPDDAAIDRFAAAMKEKMAKSREKGRGGWADTNVRTADALNEMLNEHIAKGDPMDVAILAMMLYMRGDQTKAPNNAAVAAIAYVLESNELEDDDASEFLRYWNEGEFDILRRNWDNIPDAVFIGADQLFKPTKA